jgi:hypothetical protein
VTQPTAVVIGAVIGASSAILGSFLAYLWQARLERDRWRREREEAVLGGLTRELASLSHSIMWATFKALDASKVVAATLKAKELHQGIADVVEAQMHVAAFNRNLYERVTPRVSEIIKLGGNTYQLLSAAMSDFDSTRQQLLDRNGEALTFIKKLPQEFENLLRR